MCYMRLKQQDKKWFLWKKRSLAKHLPKSRRPVKFSGHKSCEKTTSLTENANFWVGVPRGISPHWQILNVDMWKRTYDFNLLRDHILKGLHYLWVEASHGNAILVVYKWRYNIFNLSSDFAKPHDRRIM